MNSEYAGNDEQENDESRIEGANDGKLKVADEDCFVNCKIKGRMCRWSARGS